MPRGIFMDGNERCVGGDDAVVDDDLYKLNDATIVGAVDLLHPAVLIKFLRLATFVRMVLRASDDFWMVLGTVRLVSMRYQ